MIAVSDLRHGLVVYIHLQARVYQAMVEEPRRAHLDDPNCWTFLVRGGRRITPEPRHVYATPLEAILARGDGMGIDRLTAAEKRAWGAIPEPLPGPDATRDEVDAFLAARGLDL